MTKRIIQMIEKRPAADRRRLYGMASGYAGIVGNVLLCVFKFAVGVLTGAVSVTADAVNNLSDAAVNVVTIVGAKLAGKPEDKEHPFGHGRVEYVSALVVAFSVFVMSFELGKSAVDKLRHPMPVKFRTVYVIILTAAIIVKLWMAYFNSRMYKITGNLNLKAVMKDSLNDCLATLATVAALVFSGVYGIKWFDGAVGLAVAVFVFVSGISLVKEILGPLLGEPPSKEVTDRIYDIILADDLILGVHDLIVHTYGAERRIASAHAEVPADIDLVTVHEAIDLAEQRVMRELHIDICLHVDPVATNDGEAEKYKTLTEIIIGEYNAEFTFHDLRVLNRDGVKVLCFDLMTPFEYEDKKEQLYRDITAIYREKLPEIQLRMHIEHSYI